MQLQLLKAKKLSSVDKLIKLLSKYSWVYAREIKDMTGWSRRYIRSLAEKANGQIISSQLGYKLCKKASKDELIHSSNRLDKIAKETSNRARLERRFFYKGA